MTRLHVAISFVSTKFNSMKKYLWLLAFILQMSFAFAKEPQWGPWTSISCYKGIQYSINNLGYNKSTNSYWWNIRWKNNYGKAVSFDGVVTIGGESVIRGGWGNIQPGGIQTYTSVPYKSSSTNFTVNVTNVCFSDRYGGCSRTIAGYPNYADCDNGTPNYKINAKLTTGNPQSNAPTTNTNSQAYDPTFDRNNASFQDYYKRATAAGQAGNYDQAISLWNSAISVAVNDAQRNNAKAWLAEAQKAKASSASTNNYQQQQIAQQQAQQQALLKQQQALQKQQQLQQGITQLADGITGLVASIQANKEKSD